MSRSPGLTGLLWTVLVAGVVLRLVRLDADPAYALWWGYVTDEGRWTEQARHLVLFGSLDVHDWLTTMHLVLGPLYQAASVVPFALFGVGMASARMVSAAAGCVVLIVAMGVLRRRLSPGGLLCTMALLALHPDLLFMSRVAIPEMSALLFEFLAFLAIVAAPPTVRWAVVGGLLSGVAMGFKGTVAPVVPILAVVLVVTHDRSGPTGLLPRLAAYLGVMVVPGVVGLAGLLLAGKGAALLQLGGPLHTFLQPASPYTALADLFYPKVGAGVHLLVLLAWSLAGVLLLARRIPRNAATPLYVGSGVWVLGWLAASSLFGYFPSRYVLHVLLPLALNVGAGITLVGALRNGSQEAGRDDLVVDSGGGGVRGVYAALHLSVPGAVLLSPTLVAAAAGLGFTLHQLRHHLVMVVGLAVALAGALHLLRARRGVALTWVTMPLVAFPLWLLASRVGWLPGIFWTVDPGALTPWLVVLGLSAVATASLVHVAGGRAPGWAARGFVGAAVVIWLTGSLGPLLFPTYTVRDTSRALQALIPDTTQVGSVASASLFLETRIEFDEVELDGDSPPPEVVVAWEYLPSRFDGLYDLDVEYTLELGEEANAAAGERWIRVYRRIR